MTLLFLALMIVLCTLSTISANNDTGTDNVKTNIGESHHNEYVGSQQISKKTINKNSISTKNRTNKKSSNIETSKKSFKDLQKMIDKTPANNALILTDDFIADKSLKTLKIKKSINIIGNGHTLDGNDLDRILDINIGSSKVVKLNGLTFKKGHLSWSNGAAIYISGGRVIINNCTFKENQGGYGFSGEGGAIYSKKCNLEVYNSVFKDNTFENRSSTCYGAAIGVTGKSCIIKSCDFIRNHGGKGGAIWADTKLTVESSNFIKNTGAYYGAGINTFGDTTITNCNFTSNQVWFGGSSISVSAGKCRIKSCNFIEDILDYPDMKQYGNVINVYKNSKCYVNITNSSFINQIQKGNLVLCEDLMIANENWWGNDQQNKNVKPSNVAGKIQIDNWYYLDFNQTSIPNKETPIKLCLKLSNNSNKTREIPVNYTISNIKATNASVRIAKNNILYYTPDKSSDSGSVTLTFNCYNKSEKKVFYFKHNEIHPLNHLQDIIDNTVENDSVFLYDNYKYNSSVDSDMINGVIINKTITLDGNGATIDLDYKTRGFYVNAPEVIIKNIKIINGNIGNGGMGGAIFLNSKFGEIINATFESNTAYYGGAVAITENYATVTNSTFKNNYASEKGAGIYIAAKGLRFTNNLFDSNHAAYGEDPCVEGYTWAISFSDNNTYINNSITGIGGKDDDNTPTYKPKHDKIKTFSIINRKSYVKQIFHDKITLKNNGKEIPLNNNLLTLGILNQIFNKNFTNGHLLVYIDGKLVFNSTTTDDPSQIIYKLIDLLTGNHEIRVEFTDKEGNTNSFTETITV